MKNVAVTMDEARLQRARIAAARDGKSLSRFLAGPLMNPTDGDGKAPTRDERDA